jgi:hypothetical protein
MKRKHANDPPHQRPSVVTQAQGQSHEPQPKHRTTVVLEITLLALKVVQTIVGIALHKAGGE